jgi:putative transposase
MVLSPSPRASLTGTIKKIGVDAEQGGSGASADQECGRWLNNRAENSHQPFRRREGAMSKFRDVKTLQKFGSIHASIHNHFNLDRHLNSRETFKQDRSAALAEWRQLAA